MLTESRPGPLDLVVVGGLTVDRFDDGSSAPGGSVIHIARAAAPRGVRLGIVTAAGPEDVAAAGVAELERVAARLEVAARPATATFRHREGEDRRRLWLERDGGDVAPWPEARDRPATRAVLFAPVATEIGADALRFWDEALPRGAILQGWLRAVAEDREVTQLALSRLDDPLRGLLGRLDVVVASREALSAEADLPSDQLPALRAVLGGKPVLVVTGGADGLWLDLPGHGVGAALHVQVPWRVEGAATVGAGDILAAFLTMGAKDPVGGWRAHVERAMRVVAEVLEERKRG